MESDRPADEPGRLAAAWEHYRAGRLAEAQSACRAILQRRPGDAAALHLYGLLATRAGAHAAAADLIGRAIALAGPHPRLLADRGDALMRAGRTGEAAAAYRRALELAPAEPRHRLALGHALLGEGDAAGAEACFAAAAAAHPALAAPLLGLAQAHRSLGRLAEALDACARALALDPENPAAVAMAAELKDGRLDAAERARLERLAAKPGLPPLPASRLRFALARLHERTGDFEAAFAELAEANRLRNAMMAAAGRGYDPAAQAALTGRLIAAFDAAHFRRVAALGHPSALPVFILGMPRSGTTLAEQILASHPQVHGAGELWEIERASEAVPGRYPEAVAALGREAIRGLAERYLARLGAGAGAAVRITDKRPTNFLHLGLIATLFPRARIVHCRREALDVCFSNWACHFDSPFAWACDLAAAGHFHGQYARLMAHWRRVLPVPMLDLDYESVVADPEGAARRLVAHCGLAWDAACLAFHRTPRVVRTASDLQVRRPVYATSVGRWRPYQRHLGLLKAALAAPS